MVGREAREVAAREGGREAFAAHRWEDAYRSLASAEDALSPEDWVLLAMSAYLRGNEDDCLRHLEDAYRLLADGGEYAWAARCAFWLAFVLFQRGDGARGGGWLARGQGLIEQHEGEVVEHGYLAALPAVQRLYAGDGVAAERAFGDVFVVAARFDDPDLSTLARLGRGQALVVQGRIGEALPLLDEAMVAVTAGEVTPIIAGLVYCAVIEACHDIYDLRRAREWTAALSEWCDAQTDLVPYRGQCQVHRVEILRMHGEWREAMTQIGRARYRLSQPPIQPAVGAAIYQEAELRRLRGQLQLAEEAYGQASARGHDPQPGLAQLRLAQGDVEAAVAGLRRALDEAAGHERRPRLLSAYVDATLVAGDLRAADEAAQELTGLANDNDVAFLQAIAMYATAAVGLASDDASSALRDARRAWTIWHGFGAPYEAARARVLIGKACLAMGDHDSARLELEAARRAFQQLGAKTDLVGLDGSARTSGEEVPGGLTRREVEVLCMVAKGGTNRTVAEQLYLSEKTVARHLSNIYSKLGVSSRAAATSWAYEHDLT